MDNCSSCGEEIPDGWAHITLAISLQGGTVIELPPTKCIPVLREIAELAIAAVRGE